MFQTLADGLFQRFDLLAQTSKDGQAAGDGQDLIGLRKKRGLSSFAVNSRIRLTLNREPVLRTMMFCTLSTFAVG